MAHPSLSPANKNDRLPPRQRIEMLERALCRPLPLGERNELRAEYLFLKQLEALQ